MAPDGLSNCSATAAKRDNFKKWQY